MHIGDTAHDLPNFNLSWVINLLFSKQILYDFAGNYCTGDKIQILYTISWHPVEYTFYTKQSMIAKGGDVVYNYQ